MPLNVIWGAAVCLIDRNVQFEDLVLDLSNALLFRTIAGMRKKRVVADEDLCEDYLMPKGKLGGGERERLFFISWQTLEMQLREMLGRE